MRFNAQKCYILSTKSTSAYHYSLCSTILKHVDQNPYLGIQISSDLKWTTYFNVLYKRAGSTLGFIRHNLRNSPQECRCLAYIALVRSTIEYGAVVWGPYAKQDIDRLERIQRQAARFITRDYKSRSGLHVQDAELPPVTTPGRPPETASTHHAVQDLWRPSTSHPTRLSPHPRRYVKILG